MKKRSLVVSPKFPIQSLTGWSQTSLCNPSWILLPSPLQRENTDTVTIASNKSDYKLCNVAMCGGVL